MKSIFKLAAVVAVASLTLVACKNNQPAEEAVDSTAIEQVVEDEMVPEVVEAVDTVAAAEQTPAQTVKKPATQKKAAAPTAAKAEAQPAATATTPSLDKAPVQGSGEATKTNTVKRKSASK